MKCNGQQQQQRSSVNKSERRADHEQMEVNHKPSSMMDEILSSSSTVSVNRNDSGYISCGHVAEVMLGGSGLSVADFCTTATTATTTTTTSLSSSVAVPLRITSDYNCNSEDVDSGLDVQIERFDRLNVLETLSSSSLSLSYPSNPVAVQRQLQSSADDVHAELAWQRLCEAAFRPDKDGDTYLHLAIVHGRWDVISRIMQLSPHPSFLDFQNNLLQSPLHLAVLVDLPKTVRHLVLSDAALDVRNRMGNTPLHVACELGRVDCVRELLRPITNVESLSDDRRHRAATVTVSSQALPQDLEIRNYEGQMCVHLASLGHHLEVLELLHNSGANMNAREGKSGRTALCLAIEARRWTLVSFLIGECGASVNESTYAGLTPFQLAYAADPQLAAALLHLGARPTQPVFSDTDDDDTDSDYGSIADEGMDTDVQEQSPASKYFDLKINGEPLW